MKKLSIIYIFLINTTLLCQSFEKVFDLFENEGDVIFNSINYDNYLFLTVGSICNNVACTKILKIDMEGIIIWERLLDWTDNGNEDAMAIRNDTIFISTHDSWSDDDWNYHYLLLNTEGDSLDHYVYNYNDEIHRGLANQGMLLDGEEIIMYGSVGDTDSTTVGVLHKINIDGTFIDKAFVKLHDVEWSHISEVKKNDSGELIGFLHEFDRNDTLIEQRHLFKINSFSDYEIIWSSINDNIVDKISDEYNVLPNSNYVINNVTDGFFPTQVTTTISVIDNVGEPVWDYLYPVNDHHIGEFWQYLISDLETTSEGDIIGCGVYWSRYGINDEAERIAYIFKISADGTFLWDHYYLTYDYALEDYIGTQLIDIKELPDGSLMAVGYSELDPEELNSYIIRVDADGCLIEDDCDDTEVWLTNIEEIKNTFKPLNIFPNPAQESIKIQHGFQGKVNINIFDSMGRNVMKKNGISDKHFILDVSSYDNGVYYLKIENGKADYSEKFVVFKE